MKTKTNKNYCVYAVAVSVNDKKYVYIGSGDSNEPNRRRYDFIKGHSVSKGVKKLKGNFWKPQICVLCKGLTKKQALGVENELIGIFNETDGLLNEYAAKSSGKYGKNKKVILNNTVEILNTIHVFSETDGDAWGIMIGKGTFLRIYCTEEIKVMLSLVDLWNSLE